MAPSSILRRNTSTNIGPDRVVRNPYTNTVQKKSIHSVLSSLTKDTNDFNDRAKKQEDNHKAMLRQLNEHSRPLYNKVFADIREAQSFLGRHQQTLEAIDGERQRMEHQLTEEQRQLKEVCEEETKLIQSEESHKTKFVWDMRKLHKEFESLIESTHKDRSLSFLDAWLRQETSEKASRNEHCRQLLIEILGGEVQFLEDLERASQDFHKVIKDAKDADVNIQNIRSQVLNHPNSQATEGALTEASLLELQRVWESKFPIEEDDGECMQIDKAVMIPVPNAPGMVTQGGADLPVQQQLFYDTTGGFSQEQASP